jgi:hypothetical protein
MYNRCVYDQLPLEAAARPPPLRNLAGEKGKTPQTAGGSQTPPPDTLPETAKPPTSHETRLFRGLAYQTASGRPRRMRCNERNKTEQYDLSSENTNCFVYCISASDNVQMTTPFFLNRKTA